MVATSKRLAVALVLCCGVADVADAAPNDRYSASLSGAWTFLPMDGTQAGVPGTLTVPGFWDTTSLWSDVTQARYSTGFDVPAEWNQHTVMLDFGCVNFRAVVTLNGTPLGTHDGDGTHFQFDVTPLVTTSNNVLNVEVFDQEVVADSSGYYTYPMGLPYRPGQIPAYLGICQDVTLHAVPKVRVEDIHVTPRVSDGQLDVAVEIRNDDLVDHVVGVRADILDGGTVAQTLSPLAVVAIQSGTSEIVTWNYPWPSAIQWWPDDPHLYGVRVELTESGTLLDTSPETRFGYREVGIVGRDFQLNGRRFNLRGDSTVYPNMLFDDRPTIEARIQTWKDLGANVVRYHTQPPKPLFLEIADEMGMAVIAESSVYCSDEDLALYDPAFWDNARAHIAEWVLRDRNHPSIVLWSVANECLYKSQPPGFTPSDLYSLEVELRTHESTIPVIYDGDGAIEGLAQTRNKHYPSSIAHLESDTASHAYTNWYSLDPYWMDGVSLDKPTGIGEWMFNKTPSSNPNSIYYRRNWGRVKALMIRGYRANNIADIRPFTLGQEGLNPTARYTYPIFRSSLSANAVFDRAHDDEWADLFAAQQSFPALDEDTVSTRELVIFNEDVSSSAEDLIRIDWRTSIRGTTIDADFFTLNVTPGEHAEASIAMPVPRVLGDTPFQLVLNATKGGALVFQDRLPFLARETGVIVDSILLPEAFDTFSAGTPNDLWSFYGAGWTRSGVLHAEGKAKSLSVAALDYYLFQDLTLEFDVRVTNATGWAGMSFRRSLPESYNNESGYTVFLRHNGQIQLYDSDEGTITASASTGNPGGLMKSVRVEASGNHIEVWVDGILYLDHLDLINPITTPGYVGLMKATPTSAEYDNVRVVPEPGSGMPFVLAMLGLLERARTRRLAGSSTVKKVARRLDADQALEYRQSGLPPRESRKPPEGIH